MEELDIPVAIHIGTGPPGAPYLGNPKYRAKMHSPLALEEVLVKHPRLRLFIMHAGWPMIDDLLAVLWTHPQVYVDVGAISFACREKNFINTCNGLLKRGLVNGLCLARIKWYGRKQLNMRLSQLKLHHFFHHNRKEIFFLTMLPVF